MSAMEKKFSYFDGLKDGLPIGIAYLAVSFTVGIYAVQKEIPWWLATTFSLTNLTSTGQIAGINMMAAFSSFFEIALAILIINARYLVMSLTLSQQFDQKTPTWKRLLLSCFVTDEIFAICTIAGKNLKPKYMFGVATFPYFLWALGTLLGALVNNVLPESLQIALGIAIYCMFIAIIVPPARSNKAIIVCIAIATAISCLLYYTPYLNRINEGFRVIISGIVAAAICAFLFPIEDPMESYEYKEDLEIKDNDKEANV